MKIIFLLIGILALGSCATPLTVVQAVKTVPKYSAESFFKTVNFHGGRFSFDEKKVLVTSDKSGVFNLYEVPFKGSKFKTLTSSKKSAMYGVAFFPNDDRVLYSADSEGDENSHLYVRDAKGKVKDLTPGKKLTASFKGWDQAKKHFFVSTNERDPKFFDIYRYSVKDYKRSMIFKNTLGVFPGSVSRDGRWLTVSKMNNNADSDILLIDLKEKSTKPLLISEHKGQAVYRSQDFTPDSQKLIYTTNVESEFAEARSYDLKSKKHEAYFKADWDIEYLYFSEGGTYRVMGINQDAKVIVRLDNIKTGKAFEFPELAGSVSGLRVSPSETKLLFYSKSDTSPANLYMMNIGEKTPVKATSSLSADIKEMDMVPGNVVRYKSFDGLKIPSILYKPWASSEKNKVPAIVFVHGGPGGQSRRGYSAAVQHLVNNGYAVLMVNNRGSSGYGKTFFHLDDKKHGRDDLKDCVWGKKYLQSLPWVSEQKIAIMGGSYGGYMTAAALTFAPEEFQAGINIFGVTNWLRTLKSIPPYWEAMRSYLYTEIGDPNKEAAWLKAKSPLFHADKITKPLLVVQGANDPRVLQSESDDLVAAAKKNGVPVDYVLFKDEGHGFTKTKNRITASKAYVEFLNKHL